MSKHRPLEAKIVDWLHSEGYPLEFETAEAFSVAGFQVRQGVFLADQSGKLREIDVVAETRAGPVERPIKFVFAVECKWSTDHPWLVFRSADQLRSDVQVGQTLGSSLGELLAWCSAGDPQLAETSYFSQGQHFGFGARQAFSGESDRCYAALMAVSSAARALVNEYNVRLDRIAAAREELLHWQPVLVFPIIVVHGRIFEVFRDAGEMQAQEVSESILRWHAFESERIAPFIRIVRSNVVLDFASQREHDAPAVARVLDEYHRSLIKCCERRDTDDLILMEGMRGTFLVPPLLSRLDAIFRKVADPL